MGESGLRRNIDWDSVARWYDAYVGATFDLPFFLELAREREGPILELMCGTGRITLPLAAAHHDVTGVDACAPFLDRLRAKAVGLGCRVGTEHADVRTFELKRTFAWAFVGFHSFSEILGDADRRETMRRVRTHLGASGALVLALHNPSARRRALHDDWRSMGTFPMDRPRGHHVEVSSRWAAEPDRPSRIRGEQRYVETNALVQVVADQTLPIAFDLLALEDVDRLACATGFRTARVFGDYARAPFDEARSPFLIVVLETC
jgi:SAM-dependent methyltransferase